MRAINHYIDLLETATWCCVDAHGDRATGVCALLSNKLRYSQSTAVQEGNVSGILPKNSSPCHIYKTKKFVYHSESHKCDKR